MSDNCYFCCKKISSKGTCKCPKVTVWVSSRAANARETIPKAKAKGRKKAQPYLEIKQSDISGAGDGLFTKLDYSKN